MAKWTFAILIEVETENVLSGEEIQAISKSLKENATFWVLENDYVQDGIQECTDSEVLGVEIK